MSKRVLVISNNSFSKVNNNGKTLESIFRGLNKSDISQLYFTTYGEPDFEFCNNYFRITDSDIVKGLVYFNKSVGGPVEKSCYIKESNKEKRSSKLFFSFSISFYRICRDLIWGIKVWKSKSFIDWCSFQNPEYIFFVGGAGNFSHDVALYVTKVLNIPLVTFFTDDYLLNPITKSFFDVLNKKRMNKFYKKTVEKSSLCFTIGDLMSKSYSNYFGKDFNSIMNSVNITAYAEKEDSDEVVITYLGSVHTNRWKMIVNLAKLITKTNIKNVIINVYVANPPEIEILEKFKAVNISYKGGVYGTDLENVMKASDILLHVESDDLYSKSLTKLSVSTKIPEYLISGRPILGIGPKDVASMRLLADNNIGEVISTDDVEEVMLHKLIKILSDSTYRRVLGKVGYDYAVNNFDNEKNTKKYYNFIDAITNN